jgi:hypothetical protein
MAFSFKGDAFVPNLINPDGQNNPVGEGRGIFPGRVVWAQDFEATSWDGENGNWWNDENVDQNIVDKMFSDCLVNLTGAKDSEQAWEKLFEFNNENRGKGKRNYQKGEKIVVKININAIHKPTDEWQNQGYPSPQMLNTLVRNLIEVVGVKGEDIFLADPSRFLAGPLKDKILSNNSPEFKNIMFVQKDGQNLPNSITALPDTNNTIWFNMPDGSKYKMAFPQIFTDAVYIINYCTFRPHRVFAITSAAKNHFGSVWDFNDNAFKPNVLHAFAQWDYPTPNKLGDAHSGPVILGHKTIYKKTLLTTVDGLYTPFNQGSKVVRFSTLDNEWFSSILMSLDPVALESVTYDIIASEPNLVNNNPSFNGHQDNQFQEAALAHDPPSGVIYDPENDGIPILESLGVHEHWNNAKDKKYSRNLGKSKGIELVLINKGE